MAHFLLYTGPGLLVLTIAATAVVATVVWWSVNAAAAVIAWTCWRLYRTAQDRVARRTYRPAGNA